ncbi:mechanosensitive ion channel [Candidatus Venteria ishoeyi]|uniref:mechanosensitive ion channel family protein n=1 Tax=Candidatus Venteria ishoeyi TaxID=1899563 RepID=UPI0025A5CFD7|nr:mechanosensitive ion channel domain-containing protein [Candidatus Venteria ishoeyi]MDM8546062.1 mechanosensitive ion channel [Candidatus Venteria ishoeyi]
MYYFIALVWLMFSTVAVAEEGQSEVIGTSETVITTVRTEKSVSAPVPEGLKSPQKTLDSFLMAMEALKAGDKDALDKAEQTLDLSQVNTLVRKERGRDLAWMLLTVLENTPYLEPKTLPPAHKDSEYTLYDYAEGKLYFAKQTDGRWLFAHESLDTLQAILNTLQTQQQTQAETDKSVAPLVSSAPEHLPWHLRISQKVPEWLKPTLLDVAYWQWLSILLIVLLGVVADRLAAFVLRVSVKIWQKFAKPYYRKLSSNILRPLGLMMMASIWWMGLNLLGLPDDVLLVLLVAAKFMAGLSGIWTAYRLVDLISAFFQEQALKTETLLDDMLVPLITQVLKIFVTVAGIIFIANSLSLNISGVLAGLGLGGLAFALAAKDAVENLFGFVTVLTDRPFLVGDWIVIDKIEGTVESIGFRSTRIRTFYNSVITLPNSRMITAEVDNMGQRRYRRLKTVLSLTYDTPPERIDGYCEGLRELVRQHPHTRKDYFHIYFNEYAASSLDIMVYIFFEVPTWSMELQARHQFLLDALKLAERMGVEFAFPTQTLYWQQVDENANHPIDELLPAGSSSNHAQDVARQQAEYITRGKR